jgi:hypothetical protein
VSWSDGGKQGIGATGGRENKPRNQGAYLRVPFQHNLLTRPNPSDRGKEGEELGGVADCWDVVQLWVRGGVLAPVFPFRFLPFHLPLLMYTRGQEDRRTRD